MESIEFEPDLSTGHQRVVYQAALAAVKEMYLMMLDCINEHFKPS